MWVIYKSTTALVLTDPQNDLEFWKRGISKVTLGDGHAAALANVTCIAEMVHSTERAVQMLGSAMPVGEL